MNNLPYIPNIYICTLYVQKLYISYIAGALDFNQLLGFYVYCTLSSYDNHVILKQEYNTLHIGLCEFKELLSEVSGTKHEFLNKGKLDPTRSRWTEN